MALINPATVSPTWDGVQFEWLLNGASVCHVFDKGGNRLEDRPKQKNHETTHVLLSVVETKKGTVLNDGARNIQIKDGLHLNDVLRSYRLRDASRDAFAPQWGEPAPVSQTFHLEGFIQEGRYDQALLVFLTEDSRASFLKTVSQS